MVKTRKQRKKPSIQNSDTVDMNLSRDTNEKENDVQNQNNLPEDYIKENNTSPGDDHLLKIIQEVGLSEYVANERVKKDNVNMILNSELFNDTICEMYKFIGRKFEMLNRRIHLMSRNTISSEKVVQHEGSSEFIQNKNKDNIVLLDFLGFFNQGYSKNIELISVIQPQIMISISLKDLLDKDDSSYSHELASKQTRRESKANGETSYAFKMTIISNIQDITLSSINKIIRNFLCERFVSATTREHINSLLDKQRMTTQCICIYESTDTSGYLHCKNQIVGCVLFACEQNVGCLLDYLNVKNQYRNKSIGSYLMHAMHVYCKRCIINWNKKIYLCSNESNFNYYSDIGFSFVSFDSLKKREKGNSNIRERFEMDTWYDSTKTDELQEMRIMTNGCCCPPKYRNRLPFLMYPIMDDVFQNDKAILPKMRHKDNMLEVSSKVQATLKPKLDRYLNGIVDKYHYKELSPNYKNLWLGTNQVNKYVSHIYNQYEYWFDFGLYYETLFDYWQSTSQHKTDFPKSKSVLIPKAMKQLLIGIVPSATSMKEDNEDLYPVWIQLKCKLCGKKCWVYKPKEVSFQNYLNQVIFTKWMAHVYSFDTDKESQWDIRNDKWNICTKRHGEYFHESKKLHHKDMNTLTFSERVKLYKQHMYICRELCQHVFVFQLEKINGLFVNAILLYHMYSIHTSLAAKQNFQHRQRELLKDIGGNFSKPPPKKKVKITETLSQKEERQQKEREWNSKSFKMDLQFQLTMTAIEYVNPSIRNSNTLLPLSKQYIKYYSSDAYLKSPKTQKESDFEVEFKHYIAYTSNNKKKIISGNYFIATKENGKFDHRVISKKTVDRCKSNPNSIIELSKQDKELITKHVKNVQDTNCITHISRRPNTKIMEIEYVKYNDIVSESRYMFQGTDASGKQHLLSFDWVETSFGKTSYFQNIMNLKENETYNLPVGSRSKSSSKWPLRNQKKGPRIFFQQKTNEFESCLFYSVASVFAYKGDIYSSQKVLSVYKKLCVRENFNPQINDIIDIFRNRHKQYGEQRMKWNIKKMKHFVQNDIIDTEDATIYLLILVNNHAICCTEKYIFDPSLENALPRNKRCFKISAETEHYEDDRTCIRACYSIFSNKTTAKESENN